jgi:Asp-tRNA(Asn)/Glu-tRNA(Gln) amidotransferase A subunit family amidase
MWYVTAANFLGYPAISTPVGYTKSGLPIGIQFMARHWDEHVLLRVANAVEDAHFKWEQPEVYYDALSHQRN